MKMNFAILKTEVIYPALSVPKLTYSFMDKTKIMIGTILVVLLIGGFIYLKNNQPTPSSQGAVRGIPDIANPNNDSNTSTKNMDTNNSKQYSFPGVLPPDRIKDKQAIISTKHGDIGIKLLNEEAPATVSNFVYLAELGFYNGLIFHRVVSNFVIQGGDPKGNGTGGPGYQFPDELVKRDYKRGIVAMANAGPNTNGSQFFIVLEDQPTLPKNYTIFGEVILGLDIVDKIKIGDAMLKIVIK